MFVLLFILVQVQSFMLGLSVLYIGLLGASFLPIETIRSEIKLIIWEVSPSSPTAAQYIHAMDAPSIPTQLLSCPWPGAFRAFYLHDLLFFFSLICWMEVMKI